MPLTTRPARFRAGPIVGGFLLAIPFAWTENGLTAQSRFDLPTRDAVEVPEALQAIEFVTSGNATFDLALLELGQPGGWNGPVAVDTDGGVMWWHETRGDIHGVALRADGTLVLLDVEDGLVVIRPQGDTVATLPSTPDRRIHHSVLETSGGDLLFLARDAQTVGGTEVMGEAIWRWNPQTGSTERMWSSFDHLSWDEDRGERSTERNWLHANSIKEGPRGNLLVSLSFLNQVLSIVPDFSHVEWRVGGPMATHPVNGAPFWGQHDATEVDHGRLLLFDNGMRGLGLDVDRAHVSRALEVELIEGAASPVWEFTPPDSLRSRIVGSAERLTNGHTVVTFGASEGLRGSTGGIAVFEVDRSGRVVWTLRVAGRVRTLYRATALVAAQQDKELPGRLNER